MTDFQNEITTSYTIDNTGAIQSLTEMASSLQNVDEDARELDKTLGSSFGDNKEIDKLTDAINALSENIKEATDDGEDLEKQQKKNEEQSKKNTKATDAFGRSLGVAGGAGRKFGRILRLLSRNPLLTALTGLVLVIGTLIKRFASTEKGADALNKISTVVSTTFGFLLDKAIELGAAIFDAFNNPREAITSLISDLKNRLVTIVTSVVDLFVGLGETIGAALTADVEGIEQGLNRVQVAVADIGKASGITEVAEELAEVVEQAEQVADAASKAADQLAAVEKTERRLAKSRSALNVRLVEARSIAADTNKTVVERLAAIKDIEEAEKRQLNAEIAAQKQRIAAIRSLNSLNESGKDDLDKLNQAEIKLNNLREQSANRLITFEERKRSLQKEALQAIEKEAELERQVRLSLIEDQEKRAIQAARNENDILKRKIEETITDEATKSELLQGIQRQLEQNINNIIEQGAQQRERKRQEQANKRVQQELSAIELDSQIQRLALQTRLELQRQEFAQEERTGEEIKAFKEQQVQEIESLEINSQIRRLEALKTFNQQLTDEQKRQIDAEIALLKTREQGLGVEVQQATDNRIELINKETAAIQAGFAQAVSAVSDAVKQREAALSQEVNQRDNRISELEQQLEKEKVLAQQGKRNQVEQVEAQIEEEKNARDKAQKDKEDAAKLAFVLDTAVQTSNLVTAISGVYASLASLPLGIGVAIATGLSAVLLGAFTASKIQAANAAGFYVGGDTGTGNPRQVSTRLGHKHYTYHKEEFVLPHEVYRKYDLKGKPVDYVDNLIGLGLEKDKGERVSDFSYNPFDDANSIVFRDTKELVKSSNRIQEQQVIVNQQQPDNKRMEDLLLKILNKPSVHFLPDGRKVIVKNGKTTTSK